MKLNELVYSVSSRIAKKAGLQYSTEDPKELQSFIEDLIPALSPELTHGSVTFGDFWKYYEDDSWLPVFIAAFDRETAKRFHKESPIACELTYGGDTDAEDFDNPDDATGDVIYATCEEFPDGTIYEVLEKFKSFSEKAHASFDVTIVNLYALGTGDATWHFENGVMSGENTWVIEDQGGQDADLFLVNAWWLREALWGMTPEMCEACGISFELHISPDASESYSVRDGGAKYTGLLFRYNHISPEDCGAESWTELVARLPGVYEYLPEEIRAQKEVALTAIRKNSSYVERYSALLDESCYTPTLAPSSVVRRDHQELFDVAMLVHYRHSFPQRLMADADVLVALADAGMGDAISFFPKYYDEKVIAEAIHKSKNKIGILFPLCDYWASELARDKKTAEHIKRRYNLFSDASANLIACYKCREILDGVPNSNQLWVSVLSYGYLLGTIDDCESLLTISPEGLKELKKLFRSLPEQDQNSAIMYGWFEYAMLIQPDYLDADIAKRIANACPKAAHILPEEYVIKFGLQADTDVKSCENCERCMFNYVRFG